MSDFWKRRKAAVAAEEQAEDAAAHAAEIAAFEAEQADKSDEELLQDLDLPDPDTLKEGDDVKAFLTDAVPARLKARALRQLWRVNPVLANLDGLVDYGEDFTDAATVVEHLQTAYQVGKGMTAHIEALAEQAEADAQASDEAPQDITPDHVPAEETAQMAEAAAPEMPDERPAATATTTAEDISDPAPLPTRRRLRIVFEDNQEETA